MVGLSYGGCISDPVFAGTGCSQDAGSALRSVVPPIAWAAGLIQTLRTRAAAAGRFRMQPVPQDWAGATGA